MQRRDDDEPEAEHEEGAGQRAPQHLDLGVERLTALVADAAGDPGVADRTWVLLTEAAPGGWGLWGHAHTNEELVQAARAEIAKLQESAD